MAILPFSCPVFAAKRTLPIAAPPRRSAPRGGLSTEKATENHSDQIGIPIAETWAGGDIEVPIKRQKTIDLIEDGEQHEKFSRNGFV